MDSEKDTSETPETQPTQAEPQPIAAAEASGPDNMEEACRREVSVEVPAEVVSRQQEALLRQYSKQARIPGFRKGKVPATLVRNRFADEIKNDVIESLVPKYFREAVIQAGLHPVSQPYIYALEAEPDQAIRFKAAFEVIPEFELGKYQDIKVEKPDIKVADEQVDAELSHLQERQASFVPIDDERGAQDGEFAQVSFQAIPQDTPEAEQPKTEGAAPGAKPVQMDEVMVEIGGANTVAEFSEHLRGAKPGDEHKFDVEYPEDFHDPRLAKKVFSYTVKVNALKKKVLPELNDDFAKELSPDLQTLDELKRRIRENLEAQERHSADQEAKGKLIDQLLEKHDFPVPRTLVEHQIDLRLERGLRALAAQGMKTEDMRRMDFRRLRAAQQEAAVKEVKSGLLLDKIAHEENIQVSDEEMDQEISSLARQMNRTPEQVRQQLSEDRALERMSSRMRREKALNFLYAKSE